MGAEVWPKADVGCELWPKADVGCEVCPKVDTGFGGSPKAEGWPCPPFPNGEVEAPLELFAAPPKADCANAGVEVCWAPEPNALLLLPENAEKALPVFPLPPKAVAGRMKAD